MRIIMRIRIRIIFIIMVIFLLMQTVRLLLRHSAVDPNAADEEGATATFKAAQKGHVKVLDALIASPLTDVNRPVQVICKQESTIDSRNSPLRAGIHQ
jgi:ankyrin repeat protein